MGGRLVYMEKVIKQNYIVAASSEWTPEMIPLAAMDSQGIAEQFAEWWTKDTFRIFRKSCQAGVYDGQTGQLITGYKNGQKVPIDGSRKL